MDDARTALMHVRTIGAPHARTLMRTTCALAMALLLAAHVGSANVYYSGHAGPYAVDVVVRPPQVVPGIAEVLVRAADSRITRVVVRPVYWRAGSKGAPPGDEARPVSGAPGTYAGQLWLMAAGPYAVTVTVSGAAGTGTASVPVAAVATGQLALSMPMRWLLAILGALLCAGVVTAVRAAVGESQVPPGEEMSPMVRRRARIATMIALPIVALIVFGGAHWWQSEANAYRRTLDRPLLTRAAVTDSLGAPTLMVEVLDSAWLAGARSPLMLDHGKLAHLFIARAGALDVFAHLHPVLRDSATFSTPLPSLPAGRYRVYVDIVHDIGLQRTLVDSFTLATPLSTAGVQRLDRDDAWFDGAAAPVRTTTDAALGDGLVATWTGDRRPTAGETGVLRFALRDAANGPILVEPYLGMQGHAVVMRHDGGVFVHLHPSGTGSMASETAFALRDRGDTLPDGRLRSDSSDMGSMPNMSAQPQPLRELDFPYAFPSAGAYRVWVQLRAKGAVRTAAFDVDVARSPTDSSR